MLESLEPPELAGCACDGYARVEAELAARLAEVEMVAVDLDGTLLTSDKRVDERTREAVLAALDAGVRVVPATGRAVSVIPREVRGVDGIDFAVCASGSSIMRLEGASGFESLRETGFSPDEAACLVEDLLSRFDLYADVVEQGRVLTTPAMLAKLPDLWMSELQRSFMGRTREDIAPSLPGVSLADAIRCLSGPLGRVNLWCRSERQWHEAFDWLAAHRDVELGNSVDTVIEINRPGTSKWEGLRWLCAYEGANPDRIMALGDGGNDVDMISHAWLGVAMRNADASVRAAALAVTSHTNDDCGVARVLEELVRLKARSGSGE